MLNIIRRVESWCSQSKRMRRGSPAASVDGSAPICCCRAVDFPQHDLARVQGDEEHHADDRTADGEVRRSWSEHRHRRQRQQQNGAGRVGHVVKAGEDAAEQLARQRAAVLGCARLKHLERGRGDDGAEERPCRRARRRARVRTRTAARASVHYRFRGSSHLAFLGARARIAGLLAARTHDRTVRRAARSQPRAARRKRLASPSRLHRIVKG